MSFLTGMAVSLYDDARLWDALKRTYLVESSESETSLDKVSEKTARSGRFTLDMHIENEGSNLSVGEVGLQSTFIHRYTHTPGYSDRWLTLLVLS